MSTCTSVGVPVSEAPSQAFAATDNTDPDSTAKVSVVPYGSSRESSWCAPEGQSQIIAATRAMPIGTRILTIQMITLRRVAGIFDGTIYILSIVRFLHCRFLYDNMCIT